MPILTDRPRKRGSILGIALIMAVVMAVAGAALLSISQIHRLSMVRKGVDVRLMVAAEAGIETVRGRFTLVAGVQDDLSGLFTNGSDWADLETVTVNGITVRTQTRPVGNQNVLQARLRAIAHGVHHNRAVEYVVKIATFADYALYYGSTNSVSIGEHVKMTGNIYTRGDLNLHNRAGIEFYGEVSSSGTVKNYVDMEYNFKEGFSEYVPLVEIPPQVYGADVLRQAAEDSGTLFYANTISIELVGEQFERTYEYRHQGVGTSYSQHDHEIRTETLTIPDNSVIYIDSATPPPGVDSYTVLATSANQASHSQIEMWGVLDHRRVTVACEHEIHVTDNISYQTLLDNPDLRRFTNKRSEQALGFREMLGVVSMTDLLYMTPQWTPLTPAQRVDDIAGDTGHYLDQFTLDGAFMGVNKSARGAVGSFTDRELWVTGGIMNGNYSSTELESNFDRRNFDTDFRLQETTPPFFLRAYGETASLVPGTWRTYKL